MVAALAARFIFKKFGVRVVLILFRGVGRETAKRISNFSIFLYCWSEMLTRLALWIPVARRKVDGMSSGTSPSGPRDRPGK